ncbi:hypothetical protein, partial [Escherichia coli]|uniref:hypothetical protein n=1 Tax=Escherichia coli TaxID=562 RepID=UPI003F46DF5A
NAVPALIRHLQPTYRTGVVDASGRLLEQDENRDVRIAAADALRHYKTLEVSRALVTMLDQREFGVSWQCRQSLQVLTSKDFY